MRRPWLMGPSRDRFRLRIWLVLTAVGALTVSLSSWVVRPDPAVAAPTSTLVTIGFDDGTAEQLDALPILQAHGMTATFFAAVAETTMRNPETSAVGSASPCHGSDRPVDDGAPVGGPGAMRVRGGWCWSSWPRSRLG